MLVSVRFHVRYRTFRFRPRLRQRNPRVRALNLSSSMSFVLGTQPYGNPPFVFEHPLVQPCLDLER